MQREAIRGALNSPVEPGSLVEPGRGVERGYEVGQRRALGLGLGLVLVATVASGCGSKLKVEECNALRGDGFEKLNAAHTCNDDSDCVPSEWPGCAKPTSAKDKARITELKTKFDAGKCEEPAAKCRETPEIYCKQGLCVFREQAGQTNPQ